MSVRSVWWLVWKLFQGAAMLTFLEQFQFILHNVLSGIISVNWQDPFESPARVLLYRIWSRLIRTLASQFVLQNRSETLRQRCGSIYRSENHPPHPKNYSFSDTPLLIFLVFIWAHFAFILSFQLQFSLYLSFIFLFAFPALFSSPFHIFHPNTLTDFPKYTPLYTDSSKSHINLIRRYSAITEVCHNAEIALLTGIMSCNYIRRIK